MKPFAVLFLISLLLVPVAAQENQHPCRRSKNPWRHYRVNTVTRITGVVNAVYQRECYFHQAMVVLEIITAEKKVVLVETAPPGFLENPPARGDSLTVTGAWLQTPEPPALIMARRLTWNKRTVELRDPYGFPLWRQQRRRQNRHGRG
ncbi:MAG TPA: hypothetical protein ENN40_07760 [Candidatus Aminicenantes bacterium]|nr:hypothetical protein [Candidatus Aminicenantes bacterium]